MATFTRRLVNLVLLLRVAGIVKADAPGPSMPNTAANCNKLYLVQDGDDCSKPQTAGGITVDQFFTWNPHVSRDCLNNFWPTYYYCIGVGAAVSTSTTAIPTSMSTAMPTTTSISSTTNETYSIRDPTSTWIITSKTIGTEWPPKETQPGQPGHCIDWHLVGVTETCQTILNRFSSLTINDFLDWNPSLLDDCSGLTIGYFVCVRIQPRNSLTLTFNPTGPAEIPDSTAWIPPTPLPPVNTSFTASPTQGPLPTSCTNYYLSQDGDRCDNVLNEMPQMSREQFFAWNPFLNGHCDGLWSGVYYCIWNVDDGSKPDPSTLTEKPQNAPLDTTSNCVRWYKATGGDTCEIIVAMFGRFKYSDFVGWNPSVGSDCAGNQDDRYYCVAVPGTSPTRTDPVTVPVPSTPGESITTPTPAIPGMVAGCQCFYLIQSDDSCWAIANSAGISLEKYVFASTPPFSFSDFPCVLGPHPNSPTSPSDFYKWNPAIGTDCGRLWPGEYVCIGLGSPMTTITSGPPVPT